jgi:hypothetical protein
MSPRKALASLGALALVSTAVLSVPAFAQEETAGADDTLWFAAWGLAGAAILTVILTTQDNHPHGEENPPVSP